MTNKTHIPISIVGCGNCASSLIQGISYYESRDETKYIPPGLKNWNLGGYHISDIKPVCAFDIDKRKVGKFLSDIMNLEPNNTKILDKNAIIFIGDNEEVKILKGPVLDGIADHMRDYFQVDESQKELTKEEILEVLKRTGTEIIINYLPVGSQISTEFWANIALESKCAFVNAIPVFIGSNEEWADKFKKANLPIIGDDIKSQVGSTIVNRALVQMIEDRGGEVENSWQLNVGGNCDFRNMTDLSRLTSKKVSKTESISSLVSNKDAYIYAGPNGVIDCLNDNKVSFMRIDFKIFGNINCHIDIKLDVEDSPNSAGIMVDAIRCAKLALDRKIGGVLIGPSAYYMKHPLVQFPDNIAKQMTEDFIKNIKN